MSKLICPPEELRRFMGLPDVQGVQQQMLEAFTENLQSSGDQQLDFVRNLITGSMAPWQNFFQMMPNIMSGSDDKDNK